MMIKRLLSLLRREGWGGVKYRLNIYISGMELIYLSDGSKVRRKNYKKWLERYGVQTSEAQGVVREWCAALEAPILISIIMPVYKANHQWLVAAIESVRKQTYPHWELCITDDASHDEKLSQILMEYARQDNRIRIETREKNGHISAASNTALRMANGSWVTFLDQDDVFVEDALYWVAWFVKANSEVRIVYTDEDIKSESGENRAPYFKSDWNYDLFLTHNMFCHLVAYERVLIESVGGFREGLEGAQDYDLALRCIEKIDTSAIAHIPKILYHWRAHPFSTASGANIKSYALDAGLRALNDHLKRINVNARAILNKYGYHIQYSLPIVTPHVTLIIPVSDSGKYLVDTIKNILNKTSYCNFDILLVAALPTEDFSQVLGDKVQYLYSDRAENIPAQLNAGVKGAKGEYVVLLHGIADILSSSWLCEMVGLVLQPKIGAVGGCMCCRDGSMIKGMGVVEVGGVAGYAHQGLPNGNPGYYSRAKRTQAASFISTSGLLISKRIFVEVGGLDDGLLEETFCAADLGLKIGSIGYRNVWTPHAELYFEQSKIEDWRRSINRNERAQKEEELMKERWGKALRDDFSYNPNLSIESEQLMFSLAWPPRHHAKDIGEQFGAH